MLFSKMAFDKWTFLRILEVLFALSCFITKRVTDHEASRLFLYLKKLSREWSLLNNVTWDKWGAAIADTTYGGYIIITAVLLIGKLTGELPTTKRITEKLLLFVGAILFAILGALVLAAIDSVPPELIDNAAVLGCLSLITAFLFLIDLAAPRAKLPPRDIEKQRISRPTQVSMGKGGLMEHIDEVDAIERRKLEVLEEHQRRRDQTGLDSSFAPNGVQNQNGLKPKVNGQNGYQKMKEQSPSRFDIYGKDAYGTDTEMAEFSSKMERHSPVWSNIRKGQFGRYDIVAPQYLYALRDSYDPHPDAKPSTPFDPGYVEHTVRTWGQRSQKTPRHSPTEV